MTGRLFEVECPACPGLWPGPCAGCWGHGRLLAIVELNYHPGSLERFLEAVAEEAEAGRTLPGARLTSSGVLAYGASDGPRAVDVQRRRRAQEDLIRGHPAPAGQVVPFGPRTRCALGPTRAGERPGPPDGTYGHDLELEDRTGEVVKLFGAGR